MKTFRDELSAILREVVRSPIFYFALIFAGIGLALVHWVPDKYRTLNAIAEALIVGGFLAAFVDPLIKRNLLKEASRGIFIHLLGFEHQPEVKDRLQEIVFTTKLLRKRFDARCTIHPHGDHFIFEVEYETELINPTHTVLRWAPLAQFDMSHKVKFKRMLFTSSDGKYTWNIVPKMKEMEKEPGVEELEHARTFEIQPTSKGITYISSGHYEVTLKQGYNHFHMGLPTLRMSIRVEPLEGYEIAASQASVQNDNYWQYNKLQMVGEHVTVRWRKQGGPWL